MTSKLAKSFGSSTKTSQSGVITPVGVLLISDRRLSVTGLLSATSVRRPPRHPRQATRTNESAVVSASSLGGGSGAARSDTGGARRAAGDGGPSGGG